MTDDSISTPMTILGLVNGMIGGTILVLPILGQQAGYVNTFIVCAVMGAFSFYTGYLIIMHLGKGKNIKQCINTHFNNDYKYMRIYSFFIWFSFMPVLIIYFRLIVLQIQGLIGYSNWIAPLVLAFVALEIILIRIYHLGEQALAYGIISILTYLLFITWALATAPSGEKQMPAFGSWTPLVAALMMGYSIHDFVVQNIIKNPARQDYRKIVGCTFILGTIAYTYISYGSYAILNRLALKPNPETIEDYFEQGGWQVSLIEILYLVHLITVFPNFLLVSKYLLIYEEFDFSIWSIKQLSKSKRYN